MPRPPTGQTPQQHFRAPARMWADLERFAAEHGADVSSEAREAVIRHIVWCQAAKRASAPSRPARNYWAGTEDGRHVADPSEAGTAALIAGLALPGNPRVVVTPAGDDAAWYACVVLAGDGTYQVESFGSSLSDHRCSSHAAPEHAATALHAWLARRPGPHARAPR